MNGEGQNYWQAASDAAEELSSVDQNDLDHQELRPVVWQAYEYVHHEKSAQWYVIASLVAVALVVLALFVMESWTFAAVIVIMAIAAIVYARRPPRLASYRLDDDSITINDAVLPLSDFRAYGISRDGDMYYLAFLSHKRFMPQVIMYFPREVGDEIVAFLEDLLPVEPLRPTLLDAVIDALRF
jgi:hypothetical protein